MEKFVEGRGAYRDISHCRNGHLYDEKNTAFDSNGSRRCRKCAMQRNNRWRENNPEKVLGIRRRAARKVLEWRRTNHNRCLAIGYKSRLKRQYGMTIEDLDVLLETQEYRCKICKREVRLHVDHDHKSGKVRGLLCGSCNRAIGLLQDSVDVVRNAVAYLEEYS